VDFSFLHFELKKMQRRTKISRGPTSAQRNFFVIILMLCRINKFVSCHGGKEVFVLAFIQIIK